MNRFDTPPLTLAQIISMEPGIAKILDALKPSRSERIWYRQYIDAKNKVNELVGWEAEQYALRTEQAYDVVMDAVIDNLDG